MKAKVTRTGKSSVLERGVIWVRVRHNAYEEILGSTDLNGNNIDTSTFQIGQTVEVTRRTNDPYLRMIGGN